MMVPKGMSKDQSRPPSHSVKKEPKFCRCRVCHEHFYADTIADARQVCLEHGHAAHPDWGETACYCPD